MLLSPGRRIDPMMFFAGLTTMSLMNATYLEKQQDRTVALLHKNKLLDFQI